MSKQKVVWEIASSILILVLCVLVYLSYMDRRDLRRQQEATRDMLNARAEIQVILVKRAMENRQLHQEEVRRIDELWTRAEYDKAFGVTRIGR